MGAPVDLKAGIGAGLAVRQARTGTAYQTVKYCNSWDGKSIPPCAGQLDNSFGELM